MKIISLNTWGGRAGKEKLLDFFRKHSCEVDVFCLQEIWSAPYYGHEGDLAGGVAIGHKDVMFYGLKDISNVLKDYQVYFHPHYLDDFGLVTLTKKNLEIIEDGEVYVYKHKGYVVPDGDIGNHARNIQYVTLKTKNGLFTVINFHGLWNGKGKTDSDERLEQSKNILNFTQNLKHPFVLCGDFNLLPETESLQMFEKTGLRNLIKEYGITSTRTSYYKKPVKFADYAFVGGEMEVKGFQILPEEVSDHAPLLIEIDVK